MAKNLKVTIDSEEFRNSFRPHMPPSRASTEEPEEQKEAPQETALPRNMVSSKDGASLMEEYQERYIRRSENPARSGKMTYIRKEYHETIMRLVSVMERDDMSISGYIDHVLTEHFQKYGEVIREVYKKNNNRDIIMW